jgi:hypothetical protein
VRATYDTPQQAESRRIVDAAKEQMRHVFDDEDREPWRNP